MKYTQLLTDKSKEELAMLCMDKHRQVKRLTEENAKLRHDIDRAIANHSADLTGEATENARLLAEDRKLARQLVSDLLRVCDPSNWDSGDLPDGTRYKGDAFVAVSQVFEQIHELAMAYQSRATKETT